LTLELSDRFYFEAPEKYYSFSYRPSPKKAAAEGISHHRNSLLDGVAISAESTPFRSPSVAIFIIDSSVNRRYCALLQKDLYAKPGFYFCWTSPDLF
jgi:hypothetical protein